MIGLGRQTTFFEAIRQGLPADDPLKSMSRWRTTGAARIRSRNGMQIEGGRNWKFEDRHRSRMPFGPTRPSPPMAEPLLSETAKRSRLQKHSDVHLRGASTELNVRSLAIALPFHVSAAGVPLASVMTWPAPGKGLGSRPRCQVSGGDLPPTFPAGRNPWILVDHCAGHVGRDPIGPLRGSSFPFQGFDRESVRRLRPSRHHLHCSPAPARGAVPATPGSAQISALASAARSASGAIL